MIVAQLRPVRRLGTCPEARELRSRAPRAVSRPSSAAFRAVPFRAFPFRAFSRRFSRRDFGLRAFGRRGSCLPSPSQSGPSAAAQRLSCRRGASRRVPSAAHRARPLKAYLGSTQLWTRNAVRVARSGPSLRPRPPSHGRRARLAGCEPRACQGQVLGRTSGAAGQPECAPSRAAVGISHSANRLQKPVRRRYIS